MWFLLTIMALALWGELLAQPYAAVTKQQIRAENLKTASKNLDFVNKMRENLRRDNDDYALLEGLNQLEQPPFPARPAPKQPNRLLPTERAGRPHHNYDSRRGKGDMDQDVVIQGHVNLGTVDQGNVNQGAEIQGDVNQGNVNQGAAFLGDVNQGAEFQGEVNQGNMNQGATLQGDVTQSNQTATEFRTFTHDRHVKGLRVSKLKKLLQRDKDQLRVQDTKLKESDDMKSFMLPTTTPTRVATPAPPPPPTPPRRTRTPRSPAILRNRLREGGKEKHSLLHQNLERQNPLHENKEAQNPLHENKEAQSPLHENKEAQSPPREDIEDIEKQSPLQEDIEKQSPLQEDIEALSPPREPMFKSLPRRPQRNPAPLPDQIDMAHARNPLITRIRLKGRLCQRSLMNVEGPTYDRNGKQVLPEHDPRLARGRRFHQTRAPDLVLPKCCNCCKKSVLGCQ